MNQKPADLIHQPKLKMLAEIPQESVWLANFISDRTRKTYQNAIREFIGFHQIQTSDELYEIDQAHVIAYRDVLIKNGASSATIRGRISAVSSLFNHLCEKQLAQHNPTLGIKRPKEKRDKVKTKTLTPFKVQEFLNVPDTATLQGLRDSAILHVFFYCGCRIAEVGKLKVKDFFDDGEYKVLDFHVKGDKRNCVAVNPKAQKAIERYLEASGHGNEPDAPLFLAIRSAHLRKHLTPQNLDLIWNKYRAQVGIVKGVSPHSARATFVTEALENGWNIEDVQKTVSHARLDTTQMYDKRKTNHKNSASFAVNY